MSKLIDHTRKHIEKSLSPAQPDQLLMNPEKKDVIMKKEMLKPFERSTKTMEDLIYKMTDCLTSLGDGIQTRMRFVANALSGNHSCAAVNHHTCYPTQFDWYSGGGMVSPTSYNNISSQYVPLNRRASQQLNRIGSGQARPPSAGPRPILTFVQAPIMATTNLLAPAFFSQLILLFTLTLRPCVGNGDGTHLSVMAAGFGVPIPLTRRLLSVGFARSRFPVSKSSKYGLTSLLIPGHDPPVDITIFIDVPKNPGPYASTCSRLSCSDLSSDLSRTHASNGNLHIRQIQVSLQYSRDQLKRFRRHAIIDTMLIAVLKDNDIFRYRGKRSGKRVKERQDLRSQRRWENLNCLNGTHLHSDVNNAQAFSSWPCVQPKASIPSLLICNTRSLTCKVNELECAARQNNADVICVTVLAY